MSCMQLRGGGDADIPMWDGWVISDEDTVQDGPRAHERGPAFSTGPSVQSSPPPFDSLTPHSGHLSCSVPGNWVSVPSPLPAALSSILHEFLPHAVFTTFPNGGVVLFPSQQDLICPSLPARANLDPLPSGAGRFFLQNSLKTFK